VRVAGKRSSGPEVTTLIIDSNMVDDLSLDLPTSESLQTSWLVNPTAFISPSVKDIPTLSSGDSVSFCLQCDGEGAIFTHAKINEETPEGLMKTEKLKKGLFDLLHEDCSNQGSRRFREILFSIQSRGSV
jgi:hypothetical protein